MASKIQYQWKCQSLRCLTLCDPIDCNLCPCNSPGEKIGVGSIPFTRGSFQPRDQSCISHIAVRFFTIWSTRKATVSVVVYMFWISGRVQVLVFLVIAYSCEASLIAQSVKNLPAVQETWVRFLGWEGPLEKEMATHSSILAWKIPWTEEPGGLQSMGLRVRHNLATTPPPLETSQSLLSSLKKDACQCILHCYR